MVRPRPGYKLGEREGATVARDDGEMTAGAGPLERVTAVAQLLTTLDRRLVEAFESISRVGAASEGLERFLQDGEELVDDLRARLDRLEARLNADLDDLKAEALSKLGEIKAGEIR